ncbi:MAG: hypothetical protein WC889_11840 [Myxococcota bacterium]|jgi:hypothetical protein
MCRLVFIVAVAAAFVTLAASGAAASTLSPLSPARVSLIPDGALKINLADLAMLGDAAAPLPAPPAVDPARPSKSWALALPMAFILGFGSGHFYIGANWRGLRYLAYDLVAIAIDTALLLLAYYYTDYFNITATWIVAGVIMAGNRIFQTVDCGFTLRDYNKGFDVKDSHLLPAGRSEADVAMNINDGGMPRGRMKTVFSF